MPILIRLVTVNKICLFVLKSQNGNTHTQKTRKRKSTRNLEIIEMS